MPTKLTEPSHSEWNQGVQRERQLKMKTILFVVGMFVPGPDAVVRKLRMDMGIARILGLVSAG